MRVLGIVGAADSAYLTLNALSPANFPPYCPEGGPINCHKVLGSGYGEIHGFPIALGAAVWFAVFVALSFKRFDSAPYLLLPLWLVGMVTIGYLISTEIFILHAICLYCTLAHLCALLMGAPVLKMALSEAD